MISTQSKLLNDLAVFSDLGTDPPQMVSSGNDLVVRMLRGGETLELTFADEGKGKIIERWGSDEVRIHASFKALLASEKFGNLRKWADVQGGLLRRSHEKLEPLIPLQGTLSIDKEVAGLDRIDEILVNRTRPADLSTQILLIDGPAGIGKTILIEQLACYRATHFKTTQLPLILHVQSRGRVLTYLQDLIAFSLQTLRLGVTYDQIPIFVRHGLITLAIDGFDELGDPRGYDLAWAQVSDLVEQVRGYGTLIFAGRETFIGRDRLFNDINSLSKERDIVDSLTLDPPEPGTAQDWLRKKGWSSDDFIAVEELFEPHSFALRPFFLAKLADPEIATAVRGQTAENPLSFLIDRMIEREASKFGDAVDAIWDMDQRQTIVRQFLREVARDIAENQAESIDETSMAWLVEATVGDDQDRDVLALLKNRATVMAFLTTDDRPGRRRFAHTQILNHFLGEETIDTIGRGEMPKYVKRIIFGADFLSTFSGLLLHMARENPDCIRMFLQSAFSLARGYFSVDRGAHNLGALLVAALPVSDLFPGFRIEDLEVDESLIQGTASPAEIKNTNISQLDIRGADIEALTFSKTNIVTLIVDETTRISRSFPNPGIIQDETSNANRGAVISNPVDIKRWLDEHGRVDSAVPRDRTGLVPETVRHHGLYKLLGRVCRVKQYWIRMVGDDRASKIVNNELWPELQSLLEDHDLIRLEMRHPSGSPSNFIHIKRPIDILSEDPYDPKISTFLRALVAKIHDLERVQRP